MKKEPVHIIQSLSEYHRYLNVKAPVHPMVSLINLDEVRFDELALLPKTVYNLYLISLKKNFDGKLKYGHQYYDFNSGMLTFYAPKQTLSVEALSSLKVDGWILAIHPHFLENSTLQKKIKDYHFFTYEIHEALHLSEREDNILDTLIHNLQQELETNIDGFTQNLAIAHIELLLNYCERFYNRQFITRKVSTHHIASRIELLLNNYFDKENTLFDGLPTVEYLAQSLHMSPSYLSDMLRVTSGQNAQQHIHEKIISKAKEYLSETTLTVSEIAYKLGFEHSQSLNRLFKKKLNISPLEYRKSLN